MLTTVLEVQANGTRELACGHSLFAPGGPGVGAEIDCPSESHAPEVEAAPKVRPPVCEFADHLIGGQIEVLVGDRVVGQFWTPLQVLATTIRVARPPAEG